MQEQAEQFKRSITELSASPQQFKESPMKIYEGVSPKASELEMQLYKERHDKEKHSKLIERSPY